MRIDRPTQQQATELYNQRVQRQGLESLDVPADAKAASGSAVDVRISQRSRELQRDHELVQQAPDVRQDRVAALKAQIDAGTYHVDPALVAKKMLEDMRGDF